MTVYANDVSDSSVDATFPLSGPKCEIQGLSIERAESAWKDESANPRWLDLRLCEMYDFRSTR